jgi:hypothetical protein
MRPEFWQTFSQIVLAAGIIITAVAGFTAYHFGKIVERTKERQSQEHSIQLTKKIDGLAQSNQGLQDKLKPFESLANRMYPGIETDAALGRLFKEIQQLRETTVQLDERTAPRHLNEEQIRKISGSIRQHPSQNISLTSAMGDTEAYQFAIDIKNALEAGGWKVSGIKQGTFTAPIKGVLIRIDAKPPSQEAVWLSEALKSGGIMSSVVLNSRASSDKFDLLIGSKS